MYLESLSTGQQDDVNGHIFHADRSRPEIYGKGSMSGYAALHNKTHLKCSQPYH